MLGDLLRRGCVAEGDRSLLRLAYAAVKAAERHGGAGSWA